MTTECNPVATKTASVLSPLDDFKSDHAGLQDRPMPRVMKNRNEWGAWIVALRARRGIKSQAALAETIGYSRGSVADWERGKNRPDLAALGAIFSAFPDEPRPSFLGLPGLAPPNPEMSASGATTASQLTNGESAVNGQIAAVVALMQQLDDTQRTRVLNLVAKEIISGFQQPGGAEGPAARRR